jgi:hypothetical protein
MIKSRIRWAKHIAGIGKFRMHTQFNGKPEGNKSLGTLRCR